MLFLRLDVFPEDMAQHGALAVVLQELFHWVYCSTLPSPSREGQSMGSGTKRQQRQRPCGWVSVMTTLLLKNLTLMTNIRVWQIRSQPFLGWKWSQIASVAPNIILNQSDGINIPVNIYALHHTPWLIRNTPFDNYKSVWKSISPYQAYIRI